LANSDLLEQAAGKYQSKGIRRSASEDHVLLEEVRAKIAKEISRSHLSPQQRAIIELKLLENKSQNEIAKKLGLSQNQVKCQQSRAFKKAPTLKAYSGTIKSYPHQASLL
jgi:RNA polymerase sigma factor (sigma-70 family)